MRAKLIRNYKIKHAELLPQAQERIELAEECLAALWLHQESGLDNFYKSALDVMKKYFEHYATENIGFIPLSDTAPNTVVDELEIMSREHAYHLMKIDPQIESIYIYAPLGESEIEFTRAERDRNGYSLVGDRDANGIASRSWSNCD